MPMCRLLALFILYRLLVVLMWDVEEVLSVCVNLLFPRWLCIFVKQGFNNLHTYNSP